MFFDSHAHYDDERFDGDRDSILKKAFDSGVKYILNASSSELSLDTSVALSQQYEFVFASVGIHPHNVAETDKSILNIIGELAQKPKVVAIGEIGLDYHYDFSPRELQKEWLISQIGIAKDLRKPVIVHNRESHQDIMDIILSENTKLIGGVFHMFSGSVEMMKVLLKNNFYISVGGVVTFKNAKRIIDVIKAIPLDRLLIETDCPYMTPVPFRGKRNDSSYIIYIAQKIAEIKGTDVKKIAEATTQNAKDLFNID